MVKDLVRTKLEGTLQASSLAALTKERKIERETFLLLDVSGSMDQPVEGVWDGTSQTRRIDKLRELAAGLKQDVKCPQVAFPGRDYGEYACFIESVPEPRGMTPLAQAIDFCRGHGAKHLIVVSDGAPDDQERALEAAKRFGGPIDVFYVGPPGEPGEAFLATLARASGGQYEKTTLREVDKLTTRIKGLLTTSQP